MKTSKKALPIIASAFISICFLVGCGELVTVNTDGIIQDMDVQPLQIAAYEEYSNQELTNYFAVANDHLNEDGEIDIDSEEVKAAARAAAGKLFAYACYNERHLDRYVFFGSQEGDTDTGSSGSATAMRQEYYLRINENETTCGYRYHYTIRKVTKIDGLISNFKSLFERSRMRITDQTDLLYRLEGSNMRVGARNEIFGVDMLECDWEKGKDWGVHDLVVKKFDYIEPEKIIDDIEENAGVDIPGKDSCTIRANINIVADDIVKSAFILKDVNEDNELDGYLIFMSVDTEVANRDEASLKMLRLTNSSDDCLWVNDDDGTGLSIVFRIWKNGLFRMYSVSEKWQGTINGFKGTAESSTQYYYSYSDRDCDMSRYLGIIK